MADSIGTTILKAMETRLKLATVTIDGEAFTPPTGLVVERERVGVIQPKHVANGPLVVIHRTGQEPTVRNHHKSRMLLRVMDVAIVISASADSMKNSEALDPPANWVVQALQSEPTLNGLAHWISEEGEEDLYTIFEDSAAIIAAREMKLQIHFHTRTENPEVRE
jgi:hypothetical protein